MVFIPQRLDTTRQRKGVPLDHQQSLQGSLWRIPRFLILLCGIQAVILLIVSLIIAAHLFPSQPAATAPVQPTPVSGKATPKARPKSFHPALIEIGDYISAVTVSYPV